VKRTAGADHTPLKLSSKFDLMKAKDKLLPMGRKRSCVVIL